MNFACCQSRTTNPHSHVPHRLDLPTEPATHPRCPNRVRISARTGAPGQRTSTNVPARNRTELADATLAGPSCDALRHPIVLRQRCLGAAATRPHCFWRALFSAPPWPKTKRGWTLPLQGLCCTRVAFLSAALGGGRLGGLRRVGFSGAQERAFETSRRVISGLRWCRISPGGRDEWHRVLKMFIDTFN